MYEKIDNWLEGQRVYKKVPCAECGKTPTIKIWVGDYERDTPTCSQRCFLKLLSVHNPSAEGRENARKHLEALSII